MLIFLTEMVQENPEKFWCTGDKKLEQLFNFVVCKFANFVSKSQDETRATENKYRYLLSVLQSRYVRCSTQKKSSM